MTLAQALREEFDDIEQGEQPPCVHCSDDRVEKCADDAGGKCKMFARYAAGRDD